MNGGVVPGCALIVFGRLPIPGKTKTRLGAEIGYATAAALYHCFLLDTLDSLRSDTYELELLLAADDTEAVDAYDLPEFKYQTGRTLGERMANALDVAFDSGYSRVCLVGSDSPTLPRRFIDEAFSLLRSSSLVLGPARDGGYYLIGGTSSHREILEQVHHGRRDVLSSTMDIARLSGIEPALLNTWYDVDELADIDLLRADLLAHPESCRRTRGMLARLDLL